jgi:hypothetical protein
MHALCVKPPEELGQ